jgi:hypothetical protein
MMRLTFGPSWK